MPQQMNIESPKAFDKIVNTVCICNLKISFPHLVTCKHLASGSVIIVQLGQLRNE